MLDKNQNLAYWMEMFPEVATQLKKMQNTIDQQKQQLQNIAYVKDSKDHELTALRSYIKMQQQQIDKLKQLTNQQAKQISHLNHALSIEKNALREVDLSDHDLWQYWHQFCDQKTDYKWPLYNPGNSEARYAGYLVLDDYRQEFPLYLDKVLKTKKQFTKLTNPKHNELLTSRLQNLAFGALGH